MKDTGQTIADAVTGGMGSWTFIIGQTVVILIWMGLNVVGFINHWDPYPFIALNLLFSAQAAYASPLILMSERRQEERDKKEIEADYEINRQAKVDIEHMKAELDQLVAWIKEQQ